MYGNMYETTLSRNLDVEKFGTHPSEMGGNRYGCRTGGWKQPMGKDVMRGKGGKLAKKHFKNGELFGQFSESQFCPTEFGPSQSPPRRKKMKCNVR